MDIVFYTRMVLNERMDKIRIKNRVRELRTKSGLTTEEIANRAGTSQPQIFRLEKGERDMTLEWMDRLSKALNCRPYEILPLEWQPPAEQKMPTPALDYIMEIIETVETWLKDNKKELSPKNKALLIKALYEETADLPAEERTENIISFTKFLMKNKAS